MMLQIQSCNWHSPLLMRGRPTHGDIQACRPHWESIQGNPLPTREPSDKEDRRQHSVGPIFSSGNAYFAQHSPGHLHPSSFDGSTHQIPLLCICGTTHSTCRGSISGVVCLQFCLKLCESANIGEHIAMTGQPPNVHLHCEQALFPPKVSLSLAEVNTAETPC